MTRSDFRKFFLTARGCTVVLGTPAFFALAVTGLVLNAQQRTLTPRWGLWIVLISAVGAAGSGALCWFGDSPTGLPEGGRTQSGSALIE